MEIRAEDVGAIVTAVEWILEGNLRQVIIRRDGETVFEAYTDDSKLVIDPDAMSPELARHLLEHTTLFESEPSSESKRTETAETSANSSSRRGQQAPARA